MIKNPPHYNIENSNWKGGREHVGKGRGCKKILTGCADKKIAHFHQKKCGEGGKSMFLSLQITD